MRLDNVLNDNPGSNSPLQVKCLKELQKILIIEYIEDLFIDNKFFIGVRGKYEGVQNYLLYFNFKYIDYLFEFYLAYDQLEFYISKDNRLMKECNLEDFWDDDIMIVKFINYFAQQLDDLHIKKNIIN